HNYTNKGRWIYDLERETFVRDSLFEIGLPSEKINDVLIKDNIYYIATDKGLCIKNKDSIKIYDNENGLKNERINCILLKGKRLYLGTQAGLSVIKDNKVYNFSKSFGIQSLAIHKIIEQNNKLWLAGNNGISIVNLEDVKATNPPKLNIIQNNAMFSYAVISYQDRNAINFEYQLNGNQWISLNPNESEIDFNNFAPNNYKIQFRTQNSHSDWVYSEIFNFKIKPPWYKVWWILLVIFLSFSTLIGIVFTRRLKVASKRNEILKNEVAKRVLAENELGEVRDNIARDFHDDLGNKLASISLLSDVLSHKVNTEVGDVVMTIKNDADYLYKGTKDFIFSLQEKSNYLDEVRMYLSDFAEDYFYQFGVDLEVEAEIETNIKLPYYWSKQIIFIFKEAITNIVKHANAKAVKLIFNFEKNHLEISIHDNGKGFTNSEGRGNGLLNMKTRAQRIDCKLSIVSMPNKGTTITFFGQLPQ
ncbi:MAG: histidine kinase, partial [Winogradskyella sp.]|nr:histidine kinase [Winogradskyella sp.]